MNDCQSISATMGQMQDMLFEAKKEILRLRKVIVAEGEKWYHHHEDEKKKQYWLDFKRKAYK